jgi:hypothetical protein
VVIQQHGNPIVAHRLQPNTQPTGTDRADVDLLPYEGQQNFAGLRRYSQMTETVERRVEQRRM